MYSFFYRYERGQHR